MKMRVPLAALAATAIATVAVAQGAADLPDRPIRRAEVIDVVKRQFAALDANHDGVVTSAEFDAFRAKQAAGKAEVAAGPFGHVGGHWFERADAKGDGRVTLAEAEARPLQLFDMADVDHDGVISAQERKVATMMMSLGGH
ncbi:EF-hand domain-containing protein [Sphingomonas nostoxanthinifaciens]|uniref:EF-hand domain-containing protein n=1 Tax=Sphingomonas nostoxanthinifaciens TaxID=2872652 RepID=UPI001CC20DC2|nr:EF-hand domain-containing protein [Sphingomonas nostoxanthinifaciens]UAK25146.1 EF-hand domain-containing protein [Sphingomonas nostoxanthinifaciens]